MQRTPHTSLRGQTGGLQHSPAFGMAQRIRDEQGPERAGQYLMAMEPYLAPAERAHIASRLGVPLPQRPYAPPQSPQTFSQNAPVFQQQSAPAFPQQAAPAFQQSAPPFQQSAPTFPQSAPPLGAPSGGNGQLLQMLSALGGMPGGASGAGGAPGGMPGNLGNLLQMAQMMQSLGPLLSGLSGAGKK